MHTARLKEWSIRFGQYCMATLSVLGMRSVMIPDIRNTIRGHLLKDYRIVVSTAQGNLTGSNEVYTVAKIKTRTNMFLEIYAPAVDGFAKLVEKIELSDRRDGFFSFNGQATNLAIEDIDGDGRQEILAPSFDNDLVGHLQVFKYNANRRSFGSRVN